nr:MAG TPA: hypothetical protein [Caudoviricetes sp.]
MSHFIQLVRAYSKRPLNVGKVTHATNAESGAKGEGLVIQPRSDCNNCLVKLLFQILAGDYPLGTLM